MTRIWRLLTFAFTIICVVDSQQDVIVKYQSAVQKLEQGQYQSAATDLEALVERYPGQFEFVLKLAECNVKRKRPDQVFLQSTRLPEIVLELFTKSADSLEKQIQGMQQVEAFDKLAVQAIEMLEKSAGPVSESVARVLQWRAQMLHTCGLAMLSTRSTSGWGRRVLALSHAAMVDARAATAEVAALSCRRKVQWGWGSTGNDPQLVRLERIAVPDTMTRLGLGVYSPTYSMTPQNTPVFSSTVYTHDNKASRSTFVDARNAYLIEFENVYLESNPGNSDDMWGVYYTDCTVYSASKLHNCLLSQAYTGHSPRTEVINEVVFSIVVPSQTNFYHVFVETMPKVLMMLAEMSAPAQFPWLHHSALNESLVLLAPDIPLVRKMVKMSGWPMTRTRFLPPTPGVRYKLRRCFMIEFGPPNPNSVAAPNWKPWRKSKKTPFVSWYPSPRDSKIAPRAMSDPWDGSPGENEDLWTVYRTPQAAVALVRTALVGDNLRTASDLTLPVIVYTSRKKANARAIKGLGESKMISALKSAVAGKAQVVVHDGSETIPKQIEMMKAASILIGPHGAGLTNMLWMCPGSAVIRFPLKPEIERCFEYMAHALRHKYFEVPKLTSHHAGQYDLKDDTLKAVVDTVLFALKSVAPTKPLAAKNTDEL